MSVGEMLDDLMMAVVYLKALVDTHGADSEEVEEHQKSLSGMRETIESRLWEAINGR